MKSFILNSLSTSLFCYFTFSLSPLLLPQFKNQIKSIAVDGMDILAASKNACQKSLARLEAREAAAKAAAKREEERVAALKKIRGERWLPAVARDMQSRLQRR